MKHKMSFIVLLTSAFVSLTVAALATSLHAPQAAAIGGVEVWLTTGDQSHKLEQQPDVSFSSGGRSNSLKIPVDESRQYQSMDGFGAALTDSAAWLISNMLSVTQTDQLMHTLFSPEAGIGINYLRLPMGASDFITGGLPYTYDDIPCSVTDTQLVSFTIAHDQAYIIPILRQAITVNPQLKVMGSPWSAPAWMKSPCTLYGGSLLAANQQTYADYFVKFIQAYATAGITINAVTIQNEPHFTSAIRPSLWMEPGQQADFIKYLGPALVMNNLTTKLLIWDHNWDEPSYPITVLSDPAASPYIAGSAWHCYSTGGSVAALAAVHAAYPDKDIYFTECTGHYEYQNGQGPDDHFAGDLVWEFQNLIIGATRNWAKTVLLWNLALDPNGGPMLPGSCGAPNTRCRGLVTIDPAQVDGFKPHVEYYAIGHASKFVAPGAHRIESGTYTGTLESVAFLNPDGSKVLIILNPLASTVQSFDVLWGGQHFSYTLPAQSVVTFKWSGQQTYLPLVLNGYSPAQTSTPTPTPTPATPTATPTPTSTATPTPTPTSTAMATPFPGFSQNFEPANGTCGNYWQVLASMNCSFESGNVYEGSRALKCDATATGGTVRINPSVCGLADLSSAITMSLWMRDMQGHNTVELWMVDDTGGTSKAWSTMESVQNTWTKITWPLSSFTGIAKDRIKYIAIYEWWNGTYYFDDITSQSASTSTPTPTPTSTPTLTPTPTATPTSTPTSTATPTSTPTSTPTLTPTPTATPTSTPTSTATAFPGFSQNFEPANGTCGDYFSEEWAMDCSFESGNVHEGSRAIACSAHGHATNPNDNGGRTRIYPSTCSLVDLSSAITTSLWVSDTQGHNTVELWLVDDNGGVSKSWSTMESVQNTWTKITWPLSGFTGILPADMSRIKYVVINEYWDGVYYFDDITYQ